MMKYLLFFFFGNVLFAQTVSTFFSDPTIDVDDSLVFDSNGNLYGSNFGGTTVYKITPAGVATPFITGLSNPNGGAFDSNGAFYLAEYSAGTINKYDEFGNQDATFIVGTPSGLIKDFNSDAMIYTNVANNSVNRLETDGSITELFQGAPLNAPVGLAFDETGNLFVSNFTGNEIYRLGGTPVYIATVPDGGASGGNAAIGFIAYASGKLYATNFGGHQIYAVNPLGTDDVILYAGDDEGDDDGAIGDATFSYPNGIVFNASENALYVSEFSGQGNIRKISDATTLSVSDYNNDIDLSLFPNPATDHFILKGTSEVPLGQIIITIYDILGKPVEHMTTNIIQTQWEVSVPISQLPAGMYLIQCASDRRWIYTKSLIKR